MLNAIRDLLKDVRFVCGFIIILILLSLSILSFFSPYDPRSWNVVPPDLPPSLKHLLGTDSLGVDVFWNITCAMRNSFLIGIVAALISRIIALLVGMMGGYKGGIVDRVLTTISDSFIIMPLLPMLIFLTFLLKEEMSILRMGIILAMFGWAFDARRIRSMGLNLRERGFTYSAIFAGMSAFKVILKEHLPFIMPLAMATSLTTLMWAIGMEITLAVFGLSSAETPTLGMTIHWAVEYQALFRGLWWWILTPLSICILLFIALYLLFTSISKFLDPRTRLRRMKLGTP